MTQDSAVAEKVTQPVWTCYHCGETFRDDSCARRHFGPDEQSVAACVIKAGAEGSILKALRDAEESEAKAWHLLHDECSDFSKAYYAQKSRHSQALISAEELGYERGIRDLQAEVAAAYTAGRLEGMREGLVLVPIVRTNAMIEAAEAARIEHTDRFLDGSEVAHSDMLDEVWSAQLAAVDDTLQREPRDAEMDLEVALDFAERPRLFDTLAAPADSMDELREALKVIAAEYRSIAAIRALQEKHNG